MAELKLMNSNCFTATNTFRSAATITVLVLCLSVGHGEDLTTLDGKTYTNITEVSKYPKQVFFTCNEKRVSVATTNLPEEFRVKYGVTIQTNTVTHSKISPTSDSDDLLFARYKNDVDLVVYDYTAEVTNNLYNPIEIRSWQISVQGGVIGLSSYLSRGSNLLQQIDSRTGKHLSFSPGEEELVAQAFSKFDEWTEIATKNHAEPFDKTIIVTPETNDAVGFSANSSKTYTFSWNNDEGLLFVTGSSFYDKHDVSHFQELLTKLPALKEKLVQKIHIREAQKNLFK